jgi:hypothetical protein
VIWLSRRRAILGGAWRGPAAAMRDGRRFRNTEILTIRDQHIVDVEVYFGWSVPHKAPQGGFMDAA